MPPTLKCLIDVSYCVPMHRQTYTLKAFFTSSKQFECCDQQENAIITTSLESKYLYVKLSGTLSPNSSCQKE